MRENRTKAQNVVISHQLAPLPPEQIADKRGHLLLVEDIDVNQLLARTLLESDGYTVDVVDSGEAAIAAVQTRRYDAVLMDVQMPGMDGIAATRAIRALPRCTDLPIIAMTATVLAEQVRQFLDVGMDDHIRKPVNRADLRRSWRAGSRRRSFRDSTVTLIKLSPAILATWSAA